MTDRIPSTADPGVAGDEISAALNLIAYGRLGPHDQEAAKSYGVDPKRQMPKRFRSK